MSRTPVAHALLEDLLSILPRECVLTDPSELFVYDCDGFTIARSTPIAVVFPTTTEEVVAVVRRLAHHGVPIVPRGSGTGLTGGCVAYENGVVVSTARMARILKIDLENRVAHVQAGVRNTALSDAVAGLASPYHFAPDPSSQRASTIGGNAATNAGGIHTLKDFVTSNHVLGVEMVLADGEILRIGGADGCYEGGPFDLPGLICGSEGTLGIMTSLWVRLVPRARSFRTAAAFFDSSSDACNAVSAIIASGLLPAAIEMLDGRMIQLVEEAHRFGFPRSAQALLVIEIDGIDGLLDAQMDAIIEICHHCGVSGIERSADATTRARLWKARKAAFGALGKISPSYCTQDACVPRSMLADVLAKVDEIGRQYGLVINNIFHAGDGNIHPVFLYDDRDERQVQTVLHAAQEILKYCIDIGGTMTGEHGVGVEKVHLMPYQFDAPTLAQFDRVKRAFDPNARINAGKLIPSETLKVMLLKPGRHAPQ